MSDVGQPFQADGVVLVDLSHGCQANRFALD
jgi:hypothetical protein